MAETGPTASGFIDSLKETATESLLKGKESLASHLSKVKTEGKGFLDEIPFSITKNNVTVEEVKPAAAPAAGGRRRSRRKNKKGKKSKKRKTSRRGRKSKKRVRFSKRK